MAQAEPIIILGGGVAGLAAGGAARRRGRPFLILERAGRTGGNCVTFAHGPFRFDSGAHRFHEHDREATLQVRRLLSDGLKRVDVPSQVYARGRFVTFPFKAAELAAAFGWRFLLRVAGEMAAARLGRKNRGGDFAARKTRAYGPTLAGSYLLNYSQKLWGLPAGRLSDEIAGNRLRGLNGWGLVRDAFAAAGNPATHLEGAFAYPDGGIGAISDSLAAECGRENVRTGAEVRRVFHENGRIRAVQVNGGEVLACAAVLSSIPLDRFLRLLDPAPPAAVLAAAAFAYRRLALVALFLDRETVSHAATLYFPEPRFPFTRICEPRNRWRGMAPEGRTSLVAEIPFSTGSGIESLAEERLVETVRSTLAGIGLITGNEVLGGCVRRLDDAYPVLDRGVEDRRREVFSYLGRFANLRCIGRNGTFRYLHIHHLLPDAARAVGELLAGEGES
ncbi:MAG: FAD-dependent oxidoreductase [Candidatus Aminicenantes bacterium]|nr:FAD-dependent oxidoreductase [Candidatus Aminicenantes bacterium]